MANTVYTESVVTLNATQAEAVMNSLKSSADELRKKMNEATKLGNEDEAKRYQKELENVRKSMQGIEKTTKDYSKIMENLNGSTINELTKAYKGLNSQLKNLVPGTDEFVKKSAQLKQVKARMDEVNGSVRNTNKTLDSLKGMLPKIGLATFFAAAGAAVVKFGKDAIEQTQLIGDRWGQFTSGMSHAYGSFVAGISSGQGWNELIYNMTHSFEVGKEVAAVLDEIFERENSLSLQESKKRVEIEKNKQIMRDQTRSSEERLAAANAAMQLEKELAKERANIAEQEAGARKDLLQDRTKMSDDELKFYVEEYNQNINILRQAQQYNAELEKRKEAIEAAKSAMLNTETGNYEDVKAAQAAYDSFVASADEGLKKIAEIDRKYQLSNDELVQNYVRAEKKKIDAEANYYSSTTRIATTVSSLKKQIAAEQQAAAENSYKNEIAAVENHQKEMEIVAKDAYAKGEINEVEYQDRMAGIAEVALKSKLEIAEKYKKDTLAIQSQLLDLTIKQQDAFKKAMDSGFADLMKDALAEMDEGIKDALNGTDDVFNEEMDSLMDLLEKANYIKASLNPRDALKDAYDAEMADLDKMYQEKLLSEEEYQAAKQNMLEEYERENMLIILARWSKGVAVAQRYLESASNMVSALQDMEMSKLDARMNAELEAAGDNAEERKRIEEKYEEEKLETQKKYAVADMVVNIGKAVAAGALAIMQAWAAGPLVAAVMIPIITATTAAQIATMIAQKDAIMNASPNSSGSSSTGARVATGFSEGGYTGEAANDYQEMGVVHANEWVAPASMVRANPILFRRLEHARKTGRPVSGVGGFADGGMTVPSQVEEVPAAAVIDPALLASLVQTLNYINQNGIKAYVVTSELNAKIEMEQSLKNVTGRK